MSFGSTIVNTGFQVAINAGTSALGAWQMDADPKTAAAATSFGWVVGTCISNIGEAFNVDRVSITILSVSSTLISGYALGRHLDKRYTPSQHIGNLVSGVVIEGLLRFLFATPVKR